MKNLYTPIIGGLDLSSSPMMVDPGRALLAVNYQCDENGNPQSIPGYTAFGGTVPGSGDILGVTIYDNQYYAVREDTGVAKLYVSDGASNWTEVVPTAGTLGVGKYSFAIGAFSATDDPKLFMQCEGVGKPWVYDGTDLTQIAHAQAPDGGSFLIVHAEHLFVAHARGSIVHSVLGDPENWGTGAGEIGCSDTITGLATLPGGLLAVLCDSSIRNLYGTGTSSWELKRYSRTNVRKYSAQAVGATAVFQTPSGITGLHAAETYGDFAMGGWGKAVNDLFRASVTATASCTLTTQDQYWLFTGDTALIIRFYEGGGAGITTASFPDVIKAADTGLIKAADTGLINDTEQMIMGDDSGKVYLYDNDATSFNGANIATTLVTTYNFFKSPTVQKRFRRAFLDIQSKTAKEIAVLPQFDWGHEDISRHLLLIKNALAEGGMWDVARWDEFAWSTPIVDQSKIDISGSGRSMNLVINTSSATAGQHTLIGYTTHFDPRRVVRG